VRHFIKNRKGFTLVEVIVVAVIVAILALVAILLYQGYAQEARRNTAENLAASAAGYVQSALATDPAFTAVDLAGGASWTVVTPNTAQNVIFTCPANASVDVVDATTLTATVRGQTSSAYRYK